MKNSYPILLLSYLGLHPLLLAADYAGFSIPSFLSSGNLLALHVVAAVLLFGLEDYLRPERGTRPATTGAAPAQHYAAEVSASETLQKRSNAYGLGTTPSRKNNIRCAVL